MAQSHKVGHPDTRSRINGILFKKLSCPKLHLVHPKEGVSADILLILSLIILKSIEIIENNKMILNKSYLEMIFT
mgnify:FL=1